MKNALKHYRHGDQITTIEDLRKFIESLDDALPVLGLITDDGYGGGTWWPEGKVFVEIHNENSLLISIKD